MKKRSLFFLLLIILAPSLMLRAQVGSGNGRSIYEQSPDIARMEQRRREDEARWEQQKRDTTPEFRPYPAKRARETGGYERLSAEAVILATPRAEDMRNYKAFLSGRGTGIVRLYPLIECTNSHGMVVDVSGKCGDFIYGISAYSFQLSSYSHNFADVEFKGEELTFKGFLSQAIATEIGNIPIENVKLDDSQFGFLRTFAPETTVAGVRRQAKEIETGFKAGGGFSYSKRLTVRVDTTYALRLIDYRLGDNTVSTLRGFPYGSGPDKRFVSLALRDGGPRRDQILVFRIVRKEAGGDVTIVWKQLTDSKAPRLNFSGSPIVDFNL